MTILLRKKLSNKILVIFIGLAVVPVVLFGVKFFSLTSGHLDREIRAWQKLQPEYVEQVQEFHETMKDRLENEFISYTLYCSFVAVFLALAASGIILRPLRELTEGAEQLGNGALDHRLPVRGGDEIAHLATSFNAMADSLQARNRELLRKELYIEKMLDPMWVLDAENRVKDVNPAFTALFGHRRDEAIGRQAREFFEGRDLAVFDTHAKHRHARGLTDVYELAVRRGGGGKVPVLISCSPIAESGGPTGTIGVFKDISSCKELEEDLFQKNRELYALNAIAAITSHSLDMDEVLKNVVGEVLSFMHMDAGGIYVVDDVKKEIACVSHTGVPESVASRMQTYRFGEDIPGTVAVSGATVAVSNIAADARTRDRSLAGMGMKGYLCLPLKSKDKVQGILCMLSKEEHQFTPSELEFLESVSHIVGVAVENVRLYERERTWLSGLVSLEKNRAEAILSSIADGVYTIDGDYRITYWNRAAEAITGFRRSDVVGKRCSEVLRHENEEGERLCGARCVLLSLNDEKTDVGTTFCSTVKRGKLPTALATAPVKDAHGNEIGRVTVFRDITREREIDRMKTDFVRTVSHELRTPLSAIVGMTEMLLDGEVKEDEAALEYMETIYTEGQRLASMVEELLDIAKIESGRPEFKRETFPVPSVIENCVSTLSAQAAAKGISVRWEAPSRLPPLHADKGKFHQVVFNLLNNALCYSDEGASVRIRARAKNGALSLSFEDTGWGIPEQDLPHIFTKFYRSKVHAPRVKGTGLGLPLVQEIVKAHGGSIEVASTPGSGSTFTVLMPFDNSG